MQRIVIDTDGGIDDALALLYAFGSPGLSIEAITTVCGNVPLAMATRNVCEVLAVAGFDAEVFQGAAGPLAGAPVYATHVHGEDGLRGWTSGRPAPQMRVSQTPAPERILEIARAYPGEVTLVTLGPLTNAALAHRANPAVFRMLKEVVVMGGAVWVPGNVTPGAEFNIHCDPPAAREVLTSGIPFTLVGLDVTRRVVLTAAQIQEWLAGRSDPQAELLRVVWSRPSGCLHDPLAVAVALDSSLVETRLVGLDIGPEGETITGPHQVLVAAAVDAPRFLEGFRLRLTGGNASPAATV